MTLLDVGALGRIIARALELQLDPMVMTHGQRFLDEPEYLKTLMREYGLRKISIHIDSTQRGRKSACGQVTEMELTRVREDFADLIRRERDETGLPLSVASTVTVTDGNLTEVGDVVRWFHKNADVGRTRKAQGGFSVERDDLWENIDEACGQEMHRHPLSFGHEACNHIVPILLVDTPDGVTVVQGVRAGNARDEDMLEEALEVIANHFDWARSWKENIFPVVARFLGNPGFLLRSLKYAGYRLCDDRETLVKCVKAGASLRLGPFLFIIHNFMSPGDLVTEEGKARLDACIFKVPVEGKLISMCEMNATDIRTKLDKALIQREVVAR